MTGVWGSTLSNSPGSVLNGVSGVSGIGVVGYQGGSGWGVLGETAGGIGVLGRTTTASSLSAGVLASYLGLGIGTALEIGNGTIKQSGAIRPAFVHTVTALNVVTDIGGNVATVIDNPICNNDPNALLFVTPKIEGTSPPHTTGVQVDYNSGYEAWLIWRVDSSTTIPVGAKYNVLVIKQ